MESTETEKVGLCLSTRLSITLNATCAFFVIYLVRVQFSVAILCMVRDVPAVTANNSTVTNITLLSLTGSDLHNVTTVTPAPNDENLCGGVRDEPPQNLEGEFAWSKSLRGWMLSAFFWGYVMTQILAGWLAQRYGPKHVIAAGMLIANTAHIVTPMCARIHPFLVIALRVIIGLGHGVMFPSLHSLFGKWAPPMERSILMAPTYAGGIIASCVALALTGFICDIPLDRGWPFVFYIYGAFSFLWLVLWCTLVFNKPSQHPRISIKEQQYIEQSVGPSAYAKKAVTPWKAILTCKAVWAINTAHFCDNWAAYTILTSVPTYMKEVLHYDIQTNGLLSALPYGVMYITTLLASHVADFLGRKRILTMTGVRKVFQFFGFSVPCVFIALIGFVDCSQRHLAVVFLTISVAFQAFGRCGFSINHVDIAPRFCGVLCGISNTLATIPGMVAPYLAAALTSEGTQAEWRVVFFLCAAVYLFGLIIYMLCASGEEQSWAKLAPDATAEMIKLKEVQT